MGPQSAPGFGGIIAELTRFGILLLSDNLLPSVASLVAREEIRGSWWGHPRGYDIYQIGEALENRPDVITCKLISGKVTYVHRPLWSALITIATSGEPWQMSELSAAAQLLLAQVEKAGLLRTDRLPRLGNRTINRPGDAARELERRLLVYSEEVHTERGAHAKCLETWEHWMHRIQFRGQKMTVPVAKKRLEAALKQLSGETCVPKQLPWQLRA